MKPETAQEIFPEARGNLRYALLRLGLGCNVACPFCNVPWESYDYPIRLSINDVQREMIRLRETGADCLELSGGEPTLRPDLPWIVEEARRLGYRRVELQTNAVVPGKSPKSVIELKNAGLTDVFVGLHSHLPNVHDFLVRQTGAFDLCVAGIANFIEAGIATTLNPVLTVVNYKPLPDFIEYVPRCLPGVRSISLSVVQPHGRAWSNRKLIPRYGEISPYIEKALDRSEALGLRVNNPYCGLPMCVGGWHKRLDRNVEYCETLSARESGRDQKFHPPECVSCSLRRFCGGVWKEYPLIHPTSDLKPI